MKSLHLLLVVMAAAMPTQSRKDNDDDIIWFPVDGEEGVFISTKGEIYIASSVSNSRWSRQRRHSNSKLDDIVYFPTEDGYNIENTKHYTENVDGPAYVLSNDFYDNKNFFPLSSQSFKSNKFSAESLEKNKKHIYILNQEKDYPGTSEEHDVKKYKSSHHEPYQGFQPYYETEHYHSQSDHDWPEQHHHVQHHHETNFESEKLVTEHINEPSFPYAYVSSVTLFHRKQRSHEPKKHSSLIHSNEPHSANYHELPNKSGDFTFPDPYESDGFYSPSQIQDQHHFNNFYNQNVNKPSADLILSSSGAGFTKYPSNSVKPSRPFATTTSDHFVFPGEINTSTKAPFSTTTTKSRRTTTSADCERMCQVTPEFNPVCGTDYVTYSNIGRLKCAKKCGKDVHFYHYGSCGRTAFVTPLH